MRILIVDDEPEFVEMVKMRLEANGYSVLSAYNGNECLKIAKMEKPNLVLLDILMPEMDGYTTVKELKKINETKDIPIIILTAKGKMKDLFSVEGIADYIVKPFEDDDLLLKIKRALGEKNAGEVSNSR